MVKKNPHISGFPKLSTVDNARFALYTESGGRSYGQMGIHRAVTKHRFSGIQCNASDTVTRDNAGKVAAA